MRYDWPQIRATYIEGTISDGVRRWPTLDDLCAMFVGLSISSLKKKSMDEKWFNLRNQFRTDVELSRREKSIEVLATDGVVLAQSIHKLTEDLVAEMQGHLEDAKARGERLSASVTRGFLMALPAAVQTNSLITGKPTAIIQSEQVDGDDEQRTREILAECSDDELDLVERARAFWGFAIERYEARRAGRPDPEPPLPHTPNCGPDARVH